jgi:hypothetical protein
VRIERKVGASIAVLGSLVLAVSGAVPALAGSGPTAGFSHVTGIRFAGTANATSTGFAGWAFGAKAAKSVTAEFKIPTLKCTSTTSGVSPGDAQLTGSSASNVSAAFVLLVCSKGALVTIPGVTVNGTEANSTHVVHPGDLMQATVTASSTAMTATIADLTTGHTFKFKKSGSGGTSIEQLIGDTPVAGTTQLPIANFGKISYSKAAVGGKAIGTVTPRTAVNMETSAHVLQISTGAISGTAKNAFTTTFKHS